MSSTILPSVGPIPERRKARNTVLARNWWMLALRGALGVLFGILTFVMPGLTLVTLVTLFSAYLLVDGVFAIGAAIRAAETHERWGLLILEGAIDIVAALVAITMPTAAITFVVYLAGFWSILSGVFLAVAAFQLHIDHGRWLMAFAGIASIVFGALLLAAPITGALVLALWLGAYAVVFGLTLIALALQLRKRAAATAEA